MAAKEGVPVSTEHTIHYISSDKKSSIVQPHLTGSSSTQISSNLTPLFDREENLKGPNVSYNEASSSEESDYNQASVIFSLDELQTSLTGLRVSVSPEVPAVEYKNSAGLLFPSLIQDDDEKISVSSKEESDQNNELDLSSPPPESRDDTSNNVIADNKVTTCSVNIEAQPDTVVTSDDTLLCHLDSYAAVHSTVVDDQPVTTHPTSSLTMEDSSLIDVALDDYLNNNKFTPIDASCVDTSPQVETPHVETSSNVVTITQSSPVETPTGTSNRSPSGTEQLSQAELSISVSSSIHEKPSDSISMSGSIASGSKPLSEKLKPTQNTFESPGLLYAHPVKKSSKKVVEILEPAEAATEALLAEEKLPVVQKESHHVRAKADKRGEIFIDQTHLPSFNYKNLTGIPLFYPPDRGSSTAAAADELLLDDSVLKDIEKNAKKIAENLDYMLDNLRYSLHAMATCTKLSVSLHKEAIDDMHVTVDDSIKMMYAFLAKFEELNSNMKPIEALAAQIKDVSESLKILEKAIR